MYTYIIHKDTYKKNTTPPPPSHALRAYPSTTHGLWVHKRCASPLGRSMCEWCSIYHIIRTYVYNMYTARLNILLLCRCGRRIRYIHCIYFVSFIVVNRYLCIPISVLYFHICASCHYGRCATVEESLQP